MKRRPRIGGKSGKAGRHKAAPKRRGSAKAIPNSHSKTISQKTEIARLTRERDEALGREKATSEVLRVISSSLGELEPVFHTILENATRICQAEFGFLFQYDGRAFHTVAQRHAVPALAEFYRQRGPFQPSDGGALQRLLQTKKVVSAVDEAKVSYPSPSVRLGGARSHLAIPMLKSSNVVGAIVIYRTQVRPFTEKQIELVKNFAAQAVIAIENARLLNELRHRTNDLTESLEQQTATSDVLGVISSSPGQLQAVFDIILKNANRLCDAKFSALFIYENGLIRVPSHVDLPRQLAEHFHKRNDQPPIPGTAIETLIRTKRLIHIPDQRGSPEGLSSPATTLAGARTYLAVPLLKDGNVIGAIAIFRREVRPFADKQIQLVQNFASQTVIAIENARLLNELRQSLEQQTATADVLRIISSSPGALEPVFQAMLENAVRICDAKFGILWRYDNEAFDPVALFGAPEPLAEFVRQRGRFQPAAGTALDLIWRTKDIVRIDDAMKEPALGTARRGLARSLIIVPMLKDNALIGAITIYRQEVKPFTDKQVELIKNFAAQAVIAIENARLLKELRERTSQLEEQSQEVVKLNQQLQQRVADQIGEIERMSRLRRFLPPQVADLIVASGTEKQLESHRGEITALFCDLRGFTGFSESADPEDVMALLRDYHTAIGEIVIKYGGTLERFAGDGVMVIFNDPVPVENPALQAVLMALDMRAAIGAMIEKWRLLGHDLGFGIGIAHGFATLGTIGFEGRFDYAAIGTVSNVASRLCDEAKPGQILISPRVMLAVDKTITVELVGEFNLKGIRRPMAAYNVLAPSISKPN